jgi:hypothetical protein
MKMILLIFINNIKKEGSNERISRKHNIQTYQRLHYERSYCPLYYPVYVDLYNDVILILAAITSSCQNIYL